MVSSNTKSLSDYLGSNISRFARQFEKGLATVQRNPGRKQTHSLSITLRRLLAANWLAGQLYGVNLLGASEEQTKAFRKVLMELRDGQETRRRFVTLGLQNLAARRFRIHLKKLEEDALNTFQEAQKAYPEDGVDALTRKGDIMRRLGTKLQGDLTVLSRDLLQRVLDLRPRAIAAREEEGMHEMRIRFKYYRYIHEMFAPVFHGHNLQTLKHLKSLQDAMGEAHDMAVLRSRFEEFAALHPDLPGLVACRKEIEFRTTTLHNQARRYLKTQLVVLARREGILPNVSRRRS